MKKYLSKIICLSVLLSPTIATASHDNDVAGESLASNAKHGRFQFNEDLEKLVSWAHKSKACVNYSPDPEHLSSEEKIIFKEAIADFIRSQEKTDSFYASLQESAIAEEQKNLLLVLAYAFLEIS